MGVQHIWVQGIAQTWRIRYQQMAISNRLGGCQEISAPIHLAPGVFQDEEIAEGAGHMRRGHGCDRPGGIVRGNQKLVHAGCGGDVSGFEQAAGMFDIRHDDVHHSPA